MFIIKNIPNTIITGSKFTFEKEKIIRKNIKEMEVKHIPRIPNTVRKVPKIFPVGFLAMYKLISSFFIILFLFLISSNLAFSIFCEASSTPFFTPDNILFKIFFASLLLYLFLARFIEFIAYLTFLLIKSSISEKLSKTKIPP